MRRYRFRLEPVLRVRRNEQDVARGGVQAATIRLQAERDALAAREQSYADALALQGSARTADFLFEQAHRAALGAAVLDQRRRLAQAGRVLDEARDCLAAAATRVGALERLDERQRAEHAVSALREEDLIIDDLVVARSAVQTR